MSTETNGKSAWMMLFSSLSAIAVLIAGAWVIIDLKIENSVFRATRASTEELATVKVEATAARALIEARLVEVETQFRAADEFRNINLAGQMRYNSLLWQQCFGTSFPTEVYFPAISQKK